jgi:hypothetical protein
VIAARRSAQRFARVLEPDFGIELATRVEVKQPAALCSVAQVMVALDQMEVGDVGNHGHAGVSLWGAPDVPA